MNSKDFFVKINNLDIQGKGDEVYKGLELFTMKIQHVWTKELVPPMLQVENRLQV